MNGQPLQPLCRPGAPRTARGGARGSDAGCTRGRCAGEVCLRLAQNPTVLTEAKEQVLLGVEIPPLSDLEVSLDLVSLE